MTQDDPSKILIEGSKVWNAWRKRNPLAELRFNSPHWYDSPGLRGRQMKGRNRIDFSNMNLSGITISKAYAEGLNLRNALFENTYFEEGDFSRANFGGAIFRSTRFNKTILTDAIFDGATFVNCNLNRVNLSGASFHVREITKTVVYGIAAWDLKTPDKLKQSELVIEPTYELYSDFIQRNVIPLMVDDIELAQFVYYLNNHKKIRDVLGVLNEKGVLLLGRFKKGGLKRLNRWRERLKQKKYTPMIFDFERSDSLSLTETVVTMAGLCKFIVVDLSGSSVPAELQSILSQIKKPILAVGKPYALFPDLADQTAVVAIKSDSALEDKLLEMERLHAKRVAELAQRYSEGSATRRLSRAGE